MTKSLVDRIAARSVTVGTCRVWTGYTMPNGYGQISYHGKQWLIHRAIWTELRGPIPDGLTIDHVKARGCRSRACTNVDHMEVVTMAENARRGNGAQVRGAQQRAKTHCVNGHEYTPENTGWDRRFEWHRYCKTCSNRGWSEWYTRSGRRRGPRQVQPCGTRAAYERHRRRGESCADCRSANTDLARARRAPAPARALKPCGTEAAYHRHRKRSERCDTCWRARADRAVLKRAAAARRRAKAVAA